MCALNYNGHKYMNSKMELEYITKIALESGGEKSREAIVKGILILLNEKRYDEISIPDIIEKACVSRRTFYNYFHSKEELLETVSIDAMDYLLEDIIDKSSSESDFIRQFISIIFKYKDFILNISSERTIVIIKRMLERSIHHFRDIHGDNNLNKSGLDSEVYDVYLVDVISVLLSRLVKRKFAETEEEVYVIVSDFFAPLTGN